MIGNTLREVKQHCGFDKISGQIPAKPPPDDAVLWRYMDFTKFVSLLDRSALFFTRADKLGDLFEGTLSGKNKDVFLTNIERLPLNKEMQLILRDWSPEEGFLGWMKTLKYLRQFTLISCWHMSSHESAAMWRLYSRETDGVAIKTDFSSFKQSLISNEDIYIGRINYVDYEHHVIPTDNLFFSYLHKRQDFNHEQEVRAITTTYPKSVDDINQPPDIYDIDRYYEVDLSLLIQEVIVAPKAQDWLLELVQSVAALYDLKAPVVKSRLAAPPIWD